MKREAPARRSRAASWARFSGALGVPVLAIAALGNRIGLVPADALLPVLILGFALGLAAVAFAAYSLVDIWHSGAAGTGAAIAGLVYALPVLILLAGVAAAAFYYPRLNDVSTDLIDPPALAGADAAGAQPDSDFSALQSEAYPDLAHRLYPLPIAEVYPRARTLVEERNWTVLRDAPPPSLPPAAMTTVSAVAPESEVADRVLDGKATITQSRASAGPPAVGTPDPESPETMIAETALVQAIARTPAFGFVDSVALRLRETPEGTQVDMRSASGTGLHDLGQNARRISRFLADLDVALQPDPSAPVLPSPAIAAVPASPASAEAPAAAEPVGQ